MGVASPKLGRFQPDPFAVIARGLAVFPLPGGSKRPTLTNWANRCISDADTIRDYWAPGDNIGVGCKANNLLGVDLDRHHPDANGIEAFTRLYREHGQERPATFTVRTPSGGLHLYFWAPQGRPLGNTSGKLAPGIDTRGPGHGNDGGYLVGPGSLINGRAYEVIWDMPIQPLPGWLADLLDPPRKAPQAASAVVPALPDRYAHAALRAEVQRVLDAPQGTRNAQLNRSAFALGTLVGAGTLPREAAETALALAAEAVGLTADDGWRQVDATIGSGLNAGIRKPRAARRGH
ncbi:bifunctional DNA primase/polymerase [Nonomuraea maritima]|uniref:bifunctional DNA primase/polymerase n=1 Tax=Nonomuraea maritima TaxID=683260 RepID=UPI003721B03C